ncbi:MAG TPA: Na+/H+ antiporter NhaA [Thermoleophilaceae bacterium]|nr:Na+/H+ antiporter NhaA [Thermoleophilaceae bacterium]
MAVEQTEAGSASRFSERTAWARNLAAPLRDFLSTETGGALVLLAATVAALIWANSPWPHSYESAWTTTLSIRIGHAGITQDLRHWVNEGLMTFFFLVVGLEAKRELDVGQLRDRSRIPALFAGALGGMALPVAIFLAFNAGGPGSHGWGAAMSTDTAFAMGLLALVAPGGTRLRVRLLTLAVFDDLVALVVIATVYTKHLSVVPLLVAIGVFSGIVALRFAPHGWRLQAAAVLGVVLWVALYESGIDPVISGLAVGLVTAAYTPPRAKLERVVELTRSFREQPTPELARTAQRGMASAISPNERIQYRLHPWTSFVIVPLFALANAGIHVNGDLLSRAFGSPITLGILVGYVVGKPVGIVTSVAIGLRLGRGRRGLSWPVIAGGGVVAGIGFTVSLLIASLAFHGQQLDEAKIGVLATAIVAALGGLGAFRLIRHLPSALRARQIAATAEDIVDLSDDVDPDRDHIRGAPDAPVTLVEYGDYECPYCGQAEVVVRELLGEFGDDLRYVWRHLPLNDVHSSAQMAAEAAEAAAAQGFFWEMHDKLLDHQDELSPRDLTRYAEEIGLDLDRFWDDVRRHAYAERIADDVGSADASGVAGTPSFFINGKRHHGAYDVTTLTQVVRAARTRAEAVRRQQSADGAAAA